MSSIQSEKKSQVSLHCQLCEMERTIISKCVECKLLLCETCTKHHKKIKNAKDHKIIVIKDIGNEHIEINYMNIPCMTHPDQMCCLYCEPCDSLICPRCVAKEHTGHAFIEIKEAHQRKQENLKSTRGQIENDLEEMRAQENQLKEIQEKEKTKIKKVRNNILSHVSTLRQKVESYGDKLLQEITQTETSLDQSIDKDLQSINERKSYLQQSANDVDDLVQSIEAYKIFSGADNVMNSARQSNNPEVNTVYQSIWQFIPQSLDGIGKLRNSQIPPWKVEKVQILENQTYTTDLNSIDYVLPDQDNKLLIVSNKDDVLYHIQLQDQDLAITNRIYIFEFLMDMARLSQNKVLLSAFGNRLKLLETATGEVTDSVYDVYPFVPFALHTTSNNKIIIGGYWYNYFNEDDNENKNRSAVIVLDMEGTKLAVYEKDKDNQPIFTYPRSTGITSTSNGYIHVVNYYEYMDVVDYDDDDDHGKVIVLDRDGCIINRYKGYPDINTAYPFHPIKIITTPLDRVIVADPHSNALHILNNTGVLVTFINTKDTGILLPNSLAFMDDGHLLIGCTTNRTEDAKLHKVQIKGELC